MARLRSSSPCRSANACQRFKVFSRYVFSLRTECRLRPDQLLDGVVGARAVVGQRVGLGLLGNLSLSASAALIALACSRRA